MTDNAIPVLDMSSTRFAADVAAAYQNTGFAYVENLGVSPELVTRVFDMSTAFHQLPTDEKNLIALNSLHRGYIAIDTSTDRNSQLADVKYANQSESFMAMREAAPNDPDVLSGAYLAGPNQWPARPAEFRETLEAYDRQMHEACLKMVHAFAQCLNTDPDAFESCFTRPTTWLRLLRYPPRPANAPDDLFGSAPHCDFGFVTLLAQDEVGGLQVQHPDHGWIDVPARPGAFVMNTGNMLHRWSNGRFRSTPHRVINRSNRERYSVAYFFDPNVKTTVAPLQSCVPAGTQPRYEPVEFESYLRNELETAYDQHQRNP